MCYSGPASDISEYFDSIGHPVPKGYNIADFSVDLVQQATAISLRNPIDMKQQVENVDKAKSDIDASDEEWSPLAKASNASLPALAEEMSNSETKKSDSKKQFLVYNTKVNLEQILDKFKTSVQHKKIMQDLDKITGTNWSPSSFEMVTSIGSTPYMRPVTPIQQIK
ncbi:hypothetical protein H4217_006091, partial [Coemansia sp. RSA 1939]